MRRLKAGWVTKRFSAAWEKLRVPARAMKSSSHFSSRFTTGKAPVMRRHVRHHTSVTSNIMPFVHEAAFNSIGHEIVTSLV